MCPKIGTYQSTFSWQEYTTTRRITEHKNPKLVWKSLKSVLIQIIDFSYPVNQFWIDGVNVSIWVGHNNIFLVQSNAMDPKLFVSCYPILTQEVHMIGKEQTPESASSHWKGLRRKAFQSISSYVSTREQLGFALSWKLKQENFYGKWQNFHLQWNVKPCKFAIFKDRL